ncbi:MAG: helix-turn-helix transcriptional regulator [Patescibacteria group bacterium]|mgnify:CR=1 FL=1
MKHYELERYYKALGNRRRLEIILLLNKHGATCVTDIALGIKLSIKSTHKHLTNLYNIGFLIKNRRANVVYYNLSDELNSCHNQLLKPLIP